MSSSTDRRDALRQAPALGARMQAGVVYNLIAAAANQGSTLIVNLVVANLLGRHAFGRYTMILTTLATLATLGQLSMGYTATKHVAEFRAVDPARAARILRLCATVSVVAALVAATGLAAAAGWVAAAVLDAPDLAPQLRLAAIAVFFTILTGFATGALAGLERYVALARAGVVSGTLYVLLCIALASRYGLAGAVAGIALAALAQAALLGWSLARDAARAGLGRTTAGAWQERTVLSGFALPASLNGLVTLPAIWIASALLARQPGGYDQLALFGAANIFRTMVLFVPQAINNVGMSLLNNQQRSSADGYRRVFWMNAGLTIAAAAAAAGAVLLAAGPLLRLFGPAFAGGGRVLAILLAAAVVEAVAIAVYQIVVSRGRMWASLLLVSLPRDLTLVALAAVLAPTFGAVGLATAYAVGSSLALGGSVALVYRLGIRSPAALTVPVR